EVSLARGGPRDPLRATPQGGPCFGPGGRGFLIPGADGVEVWDVATGKRTIRRAGPFHPRIALKCSSDGRAVVVEGPEKLLSLWDLTSGKRLARLSGQKEQRPFYDFSPDDTW